MGGSTEQEAKQVLGVYPYKVLNKLDQGPETISRPIVKNGRRSLAAGCETMLSQPAAAFL